MKPYRQLIAVLLACILLLSSASAYAITSTEKENNYNAAVTQLEVYLESAGNSSAELAGIRTVFDSLGGYEQSRFLGYYASVLMKIADEEYDYELYMFLDMLERNQSFNVYLKESLKGSSIGSVEELKAYAHGREYEHDGANSEAINCYSECLNYFDASARYFKLQREKDQSIYDEAAAMLNRGDLAGAYFKFSDILRFKDSKGRRDSIVSLLGYTPSSPTDNLMPVTGLKVTSTGISSITLLWNKSNHATGYEVYYKKYNANNWINAGSEKNTTKTITGLEQGTSYDFKVIATIGQIKADEAILKNQRTASATATPTPTPTLKPTPSPTTAPKTSNDEKEAAYKSAQEYEKDENYFQAELAYIHAKGYKDADEKAELMRTLQKKQKDYKSAMQYYEKGFFGDAYAMFINLSDYKDSKIYKDKCYVELVERGMKIINKIESYRKSNTTHSLNELKRMAKENIPKEKTDGFYVKNNNMYSYLLSSSTAYISGISEHLSVLYGYSSNAVYEDDYYCIEEFDQNKPLYEYAQSRIYQGTKDISFILISSNSKQQYYYVQIGAPSYYSHDMYEYFIPVKVINSNWMEIISYSSGYFDN